MAIHIRLRKSPLADERRSRLRIRLTAVLSALFLILTGGGVLYHFLVTLPMQTSTSFITFNPVKPDDDKNSASESAPQFDTASPSAASAQNVPVKIIIANTTSVTQDMPEIDTGEGVDFGDALVGDIGALPGDIGPGGGGDGGRGAGRGDGKGSGTGGKGKHGKGFNDDIQVVIVLDASGSMDQLFTQAAESLEQLFNMLNSCRLNGRPAKVNLGIVAYGAAKNNGAPWVVSKFSKDVKGMRKRLSEVACDGSEEHCGQAIQFAVREFQWNMLEREHVLKVIFIAGNEDFNQGSVTPQTALAEASKKGIILNTIVCGGPDRSWEEAAKMGGGEAFAIDLQAGGGSTPAERLAATKALYNCEAIPTGSPADIEREEQELRKRPSLPAERNVDTWLTKNQQMLLNGYEWDAAEICRRVGSPDFTLEMVGGLPNLPDKIRAMGADGALGHIRAAANARQDAIDRYKDKMSGGSEFCTAALEALRKQAAAKGIDIEM